MQQQPVEASLSRPREYAPRPISTIQSELSADQGALERTQPMTWQGGALDLPHNDLLQMKHISRLENQ